MNVKPDYFIMDAQYIVQDDARDLESYGDLESSASEGDELISEKQTHNNNLHKNKTHAIRAVALLWLLLFASAFSFVASHRAAVLAKHENDASTLDEANATEPTPQSCCTRNKTALITAGAVTLAGAGAAVAACWSCKRKGQGEAADAPRDAEVDVEPVGPVIHGPSGRSPEPVEPVIEDGLSGWSREPVEPVRFRATPIDSPGGVVGQNRGMGGA